MTGRDTSPAVLYRFNQLSLEAPEDWLDASTVLLLCSRGSLDHRPAVMITRDLLPEGGVVPYSKAQLGILKKQHRAYKLLSERELQVSGRMAYELEHTFKTPEQHVLRQLQVYIEDGRFVRVLTMTHVAADFDRFRAELERIRDTLRLD